MEASAVQFANEVAESDEFGEPADARRGAARFEQDSVRERVSEILTVLGPLSSDPAGAEGRRLGRGLNRTDPCWA